MLQSIGKPLTLLFALILSQASGLLWAQAQYVTIDTFAGTGQAGFSGDSGDAKNARLNSPSGVAIHPNGNVYFCDQRNNRIRMIDGSGLITTVAGSGSLANDADNVSATSASLATPSGIAFDTAGNLYIADTLHHRIRRVDGVTGIITTVAGNGDRGYNGDNRLATTAALNFPDHVALDSIGNLFIADDGNNRVRRVDAATQMIRTVAGTGDPGDNGDERLATLATLTTPHGVMVDSAGNLFISDTGNHRVRFVDPAGMIHAFAGNGELGDSGDGGDPKFARLRSPIGLGRDNQGNIFISDSQSNRIRKVDISLNRIYAVAGTGVRGYSGDGGPAEVAQLADPRSATIDSRGRLYIGQFGSNVVRYLVPSALQGTVEVYSGSGQSTAVRTAFSQPLVVLVKDSNNVPMPGIQVTFLAPPSGATASLVPATTLTTGANGQASVNATASSVVGPFAVSVSASGLTSTATFDLNNTAGPAATLLFMQQPTDTLAGAAISPAVKLSLKDAYNNPVVGAQVSMSTDGLNSGGGFQTTDSAGIATYSNLKFETAGMYLLYASAPNTYTTSNSFKISPGSAVGIRHWSGGDQIASVGESYAAPLRAYAYDTFGNPVAGVSVTFTAPTTGPTVTFSGPATVTTNALGLATSPAMIANEQTGLFTAIATAPAIQSSAPFSLVNAAAAASKLKFVQQPTDTTAGSPVTPAVSVQVQDRFGNNVGTPGTTITLVPSPVAGRAGLFTVPPTQVTSVGGLATFTGLTFTQAGQYTLLAQATAITSASSVAFTVRTGTPAKIQPTGGTPQSAVIQTAFAQQLKAKVFDAYDNPVSGITVTFTVPFTGPSATLSAPSAITGPTGEAVVTATAGSVAGTYSVTASTAGVPLSASFSLTNLAGGVGQVVFVQQPSNTQAGVVITPPVTVRATDAASNPLNGVSITISLQGDAATLGGTLTANTDGTGLATFDNLRITTAGNFQLLAVLGSVSGLSNSFQISSSASSAAISVFEGNGQSALVGTPYGGQLKVKVQDLYGNPLAGASVTFAAPPSGASVTFSGTPIVSTGSDGVAIAPAMTANAQAGNVQVTATTPNATTPASFTLTNLAGSANRLDFAQQPGDTASGETINPPVTVQLRDGTGNPVHTAGVTVTLQANLALQRQLSGTISKSTDSNGLATFNNLSIAQAGTYTLQANSTGLASATSTSFKITGGFASTIRASGGTPQSAVVQTPFRVPLEASVTDTLGNPVSGVTVVFSAPLTGPSALFGGQSTISVTTNAQGRASAGITANNTAGSYGVTASSTAATGSALFELTNLPPASSALAFVQQPSNTAVGQAIAPPVAVQVLDSTGRAVNVSGIPVTMSLLAGTGSLSGQLVQLTEANGVATFRDLRVSQTGSKQLRAISEQQFPANSIPFQIFPGTPATISAYGGSPQSTLVGIPFPDQLQARVTDALGFPVIGASVSFSAPAAGPGGTFAGVTIVKTGENGIAISPTLVANGDAGNFLATATTSGSGNAAQFALTNLPRQNAELVATPSNLYFQQELGDAPPEGQSVQISAAGAIPVNWTATSSAAWLVPLPTSGATPGQTVVSVNPAGLPVGIYTASISLTSTSGAVSTVSVTYAINGKPSLVIEPPVLTFRRSGNAAPAPQTLRATSSSRPISYRVSVQVSTPPGGSWLTVSPVNGRTVGTVAVTADPTGLPPGVYDASVLFTPLESGVNAVAVPVTMVVGCAQGGCIPQPVITAVVNGASFHPTGTPGAIMTILGNNFSTDVYVSSSYPLPTILGRTSVTVDGIPAPLYYVSPTQINFQMPSAVQTFGGNVVVLNGAPGLRSSTSHKAVLGPVDPGLFVTPEKRAAALNGDLTPHTPATPIPAGGYLILYLTGYGPVTPPVSDGTAAPGSPLSLINSPVTVTIGSKYADVSYQGLAPGFAGLGQLNVIVPAGLAPGDQPVVISTSGYSSNVGIITVK